MSKQKKGVQWIRIKEKIRKKPKREKGRKWIEKGRKGKKRKGGFSRRSDGRIPTVRELKSVHTTRVTCGYQNLRVLSNSKR